MIRIKSTNSDTYQILNRYTVAREQDISDPDLRIRVMLCPSKAPFFVYHVDWKNE
jgi:hypothetical protein